MDNFKESKTSDIRHCFISLNGYFIEWLKSTLFRVCKVYKQYLYIFCVIVYQLSC